MTKKTTLKLVTTGALALLMMAPIAETVVPLVQTQIVYAEDTGNSSAKFDPDKAIEWYRNKMGKVTYSMDSRNGPSSYDCSSSLTYALDAGGISYTGSWPFTTESLHEWLLQNNFELVVEGDWSSNKEIGQTQKGDIFIWGKKGSSSGANGHTGIFSDSNKIIHCNYGNNGITENDYDSYKAGAGDHGYVYIYRSKSVSSTTATADGGVTKTDNTVKGSMSYVTSELVNGLKQIFTMDQLKREDAADTGSSTSDSSTSDAKSTDEEVDLAKFLTNGSGTAATNAGNLGGLIAFSQTPSSVLDDATDEDGTFGTTDSSNGTTYNYETLRTLKLPVSSKDGKNTYAETGGFYTYLTYGRSITSLGLASTDRPTMIMVALAWLLLAVYAATLLVPILFNLLLWVLNVFNPFMWVALLTSKMGGFLESSIGSGTLPTVIKPVAQFMTDLYDGVMDLATTVWFPVYLALGVALLFFGRGQRGKQMLRSFAARLVIQVLGLALIGGVYTSVIAQAYNIVPHMSSMGGYSNYLVTTSFVRFDDWARYTRLATPTSTGTLATSDDDSLIQYNESTHTGIMNADSYRQGVAAVNLLAETRAGNTDGISTMQSVMSFITGSNSSDQLTTGATYDQSVDSNTDGNKFSFDLKSLLNTSDSRFVFDLLSTYAGGSTNSYSSSVFESDVQGAIKSEDDLNKAYNGLVNFRISDLKATDALLSRGYASYDTLKDDETKKSTFGLSLNLYSSNIFNNGSLTGSEGSGVHTYYVEGGQSTIVGDDASAHIVQTQGTNAVGQNAYVGDSSINGFGLSDLAMYNFLSTKFDTDSATVTSHTESNSSQVTTQYQAVTLAGTGWNGLLTILEDIVIMGGVVFIAYITIGSSIARIMGLVGRMPIGIVSTGFGSFRGFAQLLTTTGGVVAYLFAGAFAYIVFSEFYIFLLQMASNFGSGHVSFGLLLMLL